MTEHVRARLDRDHHETLERVVACADAVAATWDQPPMTSDAVTTSLTACLRRTGTLDALTRVLRTAVDAAGGSLRAHPVPAPPYVTVTSVGPVLRGTLDDDERLVVTLRVFVVERDPVRYVRAETDASSLVEVERR